MGGHPFNISDSVKVPERSLLPSLPEVRVLPPFGCTASVEDPVGLVDHSQTVRNDGDVACEMLCHVDDDVKLCAVCGLDFPR
eukprot:13394998-Heterocapsa_arctica.AAC.1